MAVDINNKALRGSISQIILNALLSGDKYGYEICKDIEQKTNGTLVLKQPSLYSSLRRMEEQGLITSYWGDSDLGGRRHYYKMTEKGKAHYEKHSVNWEDFNQLLNALNPVTPADQSIGEIKEDISTIADNINQLEKSNKASSNIVNNDIKFSGVVKQEDLFSLNSTPPKVVEEKEEISTNFIQFDMFNQNTNFVKTTEDSMPEQLTAFTNKYASQDSHKTSIEPDPSSIIKKYDKVNITDLDNIKNNYNSFSNHKPAEKSTNYGNFDTFSMDSLLEQDFSNIANIQPDSVALAETANLEENEEKVNFIFDKKDIEEEVVYINTNTANDKPVEETLTQQPTTENNFDIDAVEKTIEEPAQTINFSNVLQNIEQESQPSKNLEDYDEVLKPHEFIEIDHAEVINKYNRPDEYNPIRYTAPSNNIVEKPSKHKEDINYKDVLGELYAGTNRKDPYEVKFNQEQNIEDQLVETSKTSNIALFENQPEEIATPNEFVPRTNNNLDIVATQFRQEGIKFRTYNKSVYSAKQGDNYINYNKLRVCQGWFVWLFMIMEILITGVVLHRANMLPTSQLSIYWWAFGLSFIYPTILTIAYYIDPYKKTSSSFKLSINIFNKFLATLVAVVFIFAINLFIGMTSLNQIDFLSYWLLPTILTSNFMISTLLYYILLKTKRFNV